MSKNAIFVCFIYSKIIMDFNKRMDFGVSECNVA